MTDNHNPDQKPHHSQDENLGRPVVQNPVQPVFGSPGMPAAKPKRRVPLVPAILAGSALFVVGGLAGGAVGASAVMVADSAGTSQMPGGQNGPGGMGGQNGNGAQPGGQSDGGGMPGGQSAGGAPGGQSNGMPGAQSGNSTNGSNSDSSDGSSSNSSDGSSSDAATQDEATQD